ncbi:MAG: hypothetical protein UV61_C0001G0072 [Candidatus Gottesmanbacteria bacterium GW2011_GWB1_43_11]|uniref:Uncharacterized protein n=1 Tax=Candidatus Gottesmanbacteria bacterium GW2011_GWB1_43_11 TaxID=1618446 RepID=A0A0G1CPM8_9BACT|nr:MAG: hypothetical protein UV04_C0004G0014 [Candidatus Gottesmanbacteria bacterium GW2011_GWA2_42_16]KKS56037.1 MAG: hypothetical protein UV17_C0003G0009 [Candidatus Gottesmanbacteria bacterium GW2011_GWA1_42_26]KKS81651.1 MAG: hypothetical protein UV55_C0011G0045 [Candidatus Gottesmanbacteria bacterium GW2011_GWC1_43_10]KKS87665.1 MAG: hypothetical protein UV61_C0001G0072 [Candidatus Gottesmanbacteria bacterium GW2011_GWB1_43_11]
MIVAMPNLPDPQLGISSVGNNQPQNHGLNQPVVQMASGLPKEQEPVQTAETGRIEEVVTDIEVSPELVQAGVTKTSETIHLPPDLQQMGVQALGMAQPVTTATTVQLPLTDDQILTGLHAQIMTSLKWLAEWCIRRLKQAHLHIKIIGGKVIRQSY